MWRATCRSRRLHPLQLSSVPRPAVQQRASSSSSSRPTVRPVGETDNAPATRGREDLAAQFAGGSNKKSVAQSNAEVQRVKSESKHLLHFCANLLASPFSNTLSEQTHMICKPFCEYVDQMWTACSTPWGSENWRIDLISGALGKAAMQTWAFGQRPSAGRCGVLGLPCF